MSARGSEIHCAALVNFAGGVPSYGWQSGEFTGVITDTAVGNITLILAAANGIDITEAAWSITAFPAAANPQIEFNVNQTTDTLIQIVTWDEGAGPAAVADIEFCIHCYRLVRI